MILSNVLIILFFNLFLFIFKSCLFCSISLNIVLLLISNDEINIFHHGEIKNAFTPNNKYGEIINLKRDNNKNFEILFGLGFTNFNEK